MNALLRRLAVVCLLAAAPAATTMMTPVRADGTRDDGTRDAEQRSHVRAELAEAYGRLPLRFEANQGQADPRVKFISRGQGYNLYLTPDEAVLVLRRGLKGTSAEGAAIRTVVRLRLEGADPDSPVDGAGELSSRSNYFVGKDPRRWRTGISNYAKVVYRNVYPRVDLVYYGNQGELEYDFVVRPGADPRAIALRFEGADALRLDAAGDLVLSTPAGELRQRRPVLYQLANGSRQHVGGRYVLKGGGRVGFEVDAYDRTRELIVDPVLSYSTFLGGFSNDQGNAVAVDSSGSAYVTGRTDSIDFPTAGARQDFNAGFSDVFVTKLNPQGTALVYSTYLGGSSVDQGNEIALDAEGNAYVAGSTSSLDFPVTAGAFQSALGGNNDAFVTKLGPAGNVLAFSTYLGGSIADTANGVAVDGVGRAYLTGFTFSMDFPTRTPLQAVNRGAGDAFVARFNAAGTALEYSTYLGGNSRDDGNSVAVRGEEAYLCGNTTSANFPTANAARPAYGGGTNDGFVTRLNNTGTALVYSTFLGGFSTDICNAVAVDNAGSAYVTGFTSSNNFPTANPLQGSPRGLDDAFVTKLAPAGNAFAYSTYLGGNDGDAGEGIAVMPGGTRAFVTGRTNSFNFPSVDPAQAANRGNGDAFVAALDTSGSTLVYSTYLGGSGPDSGHDIAADGAGDAYVTGVTRSFDFPSTPGVVQPSPRGNNEAFVAKLGTAAPALTLSLTPASQTIQAGQDGSLTVTLSPAQSSPTVVTLNSSTPSVASVQTAVTIPANQQTASFNVMANAQGSATITAAFGSLTASASVNVPPPPTPTLRLDPATQTVEVGDAGMLTVTLSPAQATDSAVSLGSSNASVASVQTSVTVPAGQTTASFPVNGLAQGSATITAAFGGLSANANVNVTAPPPPLPTVSLSPASQTIQAAQAATLTAALSAAQGADTTVALTSSNSGVVSAPSSVTIPAGQTSASFQVTGVAAGTATVTARLPEALGGASAGATLTVNDAPPPPPPPTITLSPFSLTIRVGNVGQLTVNISAAQNTDTTVRLSSTAPAVATVPDSVVIPRGSTSATFEVTANSRGRTGVLATLPATLGGSGAKASVSVIE
ncbi:MAG TPA: SBBP repeat-containing protein [Pyrinomonadaceae bacterium]|nr:SBBP repeat-containing protein [Pyrinomonadaceae bacterium]